MSRVRRSAELENQVICRAQSGYSHNRFYVEPMLCLIQAIVRKDKISNGSCDDRA